MRFRLSSFPLVLLLLTATACSDDDSPGDAGADARADGSSGCRMVDCQNVAKPSVPCGPGTVAEFTCARSFDNKCEWTQPRCTPGTDAGLGDAGDAGEAGGDATAASDGADAADDAADAPAEAGL